MLTLIQEKAHVWGNWFHELKFKKQTKPQTSHSPFFFNTKITTVFSLLHAKNGYDSSATLLLSQDESTEPTHLFMSIVEEVSILLGVTIPGIEEMLWHLALCTRRELWLNLGPFSLK